MALKRPNANTNVETEVKEEAVVEEQAVETQAPVQAQKPKAAKAEATENTGVDSDKIVFLNPLGDPSNPDSTTDKATGKKYETPTIVGYRFKTLIDLDIPDVGLGEDATKNTMSYDPAKISNTRHVKAGETFDLTRFETGVLLADDRFNAKVSGEGKVYTVAYGAASKNDGGLSTVGAVPTVLLRAANANESVKDSKFINVLTFTKTQVNGQTRKVRTIEPGFEKFEPLTHVGQGRSSSSNATNANGVTRNQAAAKFLEIVNARKAQAGSAQ